MTAGDVLAQPASKVGALAVDRTNGFFYGFSYDQPSRADAERRALDEARKRGSNNAQIVLVWSGAGCGAYETVNERDGDAYGLGTAASRQQAEAIAGQEAAKRSNGRPTPNHAWACNSNDPAPFQVLRNDPVGQSAGADMIFRPNRLASDIALSPDSKTLAVLAYGDGKLLLFDVRTGELTHTLEGLSTAPGDIAFSPDGALVAGCDSSQLIIWNARTGARVASQTMKNPILRDLAFSADGRQIFALGAQEKYDGPEQGWMYWIFSAADASTVRKVTLLDSHTYASYGGVYASNLVVTFGDKPGQSLKFWDPSTGRLILAKAPFQTVRGGGVSRDGQLIAATGDGVTLWDTRGQKLAQFGGGTVYEASFSPDGRRLATANYDKTVVVWDLATSQPAVTMKGHTGWVTQVAYSADGRMIASSSEDGTVRLWDAATGAPIKMPAKPQAASPRAANQSGPAAPPKASPPAQSPKPAQVATPKATPPAPVPAPQPHVAAEEEGMRKLNEENIARQAAAAARDKADRDRYEQDVAKAEAARVKYEREEAERKAAVAADQAKFAASQRAYADEQAKAAAARAAYEAEVARADEARRKYEADQAEYQRKTGKR